MCSTGEFGVVYKGHLLKDLGQTVVGVVAIKTLKGLFGRVTKITYNQTFCICTLLWDTSLAH